MEPELSQVPDANNQQPAEILPSQGVETNQEAPINNNNPVLPEQDSQVYTNKAAGFNGKLFLFLSVFAVTTVLLIGGFLGWNYFNKNKLNTNNDSGEAPNSVESNKQGDLAVTGLDQILNSMKEVEVYEPGSIKYKTLVLKDDVAVSSRGLEVAMGSAEGRAFYGTEYPRPELRAGNFVANIELSQVTDRIGTKINSSYSTGININTVQTETIEISAESFLWGPHEGIESLGDYIKCGYYENIEDGATDYFLSTCFFHIIIIRSPFDFDELDVVTEIKSGDDKEIGIPSREQFIKTFHAANKQIIQKISDHFLRSNNITN